MRVPDHISCLLKKLCAGQQAIVRTGHGATNWFKIGKGVHQGCILSPCLLNLYSEYFMWNARLDELQTGIKIFGRNINNHRYADDTTLAAESKEDAYPVHPAGNCCVIPAEALLASCWLCGCWHSLACICIALHGLDLQVCLCSAFMLPSLLLCVLPLTLLLSLKDTYDCI